MTNFQLLLLVGLPELFPVQDQGQLWVSLLELLVEDVAAGFGQPVEVGVNQDCGEHDQLLILGQVLGPEPGVLEVLLGSGRDRLDHQAGTLLAPDQGLGTDLVLGHEIVGQEDLAPLQSIVGNCPEQGDQSLAFTCV